MKLLVLEKAGAVLYSYMVSTQKPVKKPPICIEKKTEIQLLHWKILEDFPCSQWEMDTGENPKYQWKWRLAWTALSVRIFSICRYYKKFFNKNTISRRHSTKFKTISANKESTDFTYIPSLSLEGSLEPKVISLEPMHPPPAVTSWWE